MKRSTVFMLFILIGMHLHAEKDTVSYNSMKEALKQPEVVFKLYLHGALFRDELAQLPKLTELVVLSISRSDLQHLPVEILSLSSLRELRIIDNKKLLELPDNLGDLKNLRSLSIMFSKRLHEIPSSIGELTNLRTLRIVDNDSLVALPSSIGHLSNLQELIINLKAQAREIPATIGNLKQLKWLELSGFNNFRIPEEIGGLSKLEYLYIRSIRGETLELPLSIGSLPSLKTLKLSGKISTIPSSFGNLQIETLILSWTNFKVFPIELCSLKRLNTLRLEGNYEMKKIPKEVAQLVDLKKIVLKGNNMLDLKTLKYFSFCKKLTIIDFSASKIKKLPRQLTNIHSLKKIMLRSLSREYVKPDWNQIGNVLSKIDSLETIDFSKNKIDKLPLSFAKLKQIDTLILNGINVSDLKILKGTNIKVLWMVGCGLKDIPLNIEELQSLTDVDLSSNEFVNIDDRITTLGNLQKLDLSWQQDSPGDSDLGTDYSTMEELPPSLNQMSSLRLLDLRGNSKIEDKIPKLQSDLVNCEVLYETWENIMLELLPKLK